MISAITRRPKDSILILKDLINFSESRHGYLNLEKFNKNSPITEIYRGIKDDRWATDELANMDLFNENSSHKFRYAKGKLYKEIINSFFKNRIEADIGTEKIDLEYQKLNKEFYIYNTIQRDSFKRSSIYLAEKIIAQCITLTIPEFVLKICPELIRYYSIFDINLPKVDYYQQVYIEYKQTLKLESEIQILYAKMMNLYVQTHTPTSKEIDFYDKTLSHYKPFINKINSSRFHVFYYLMLVFKYYSIKKYKKMDDTAKTALSYLNTLKHRRIKPMNMFLHKRIEANLVLGKTNTCEHLLLETLNNTTPGTTNWYNNLNISITLSLHQKNYKKSVDTFLKGRKHINYNSLNKTTRYRWGLLEAYINFLQLSKSKSFNISRYRINKYINDTPQYSKDKKGRNIQLIIAQLLFYIIDKNWDKMEEKIDALQRYGTRYLRKNELFRSQVFIKMLLEIPRRMYHPQAIIRHTAKYRKRLEEMAPNIDLNGSTLEIIPYEHLWELIIQNIVPPKYTRESALELGGET